MTVIFINTFMPIFAAEYEGGARKNPSRKERAEIIPIEPVQVMLS